jgi:DNA-binding transcriptional MerR regulator
MSDSNGRLLAATEILQQTAEEFKQHAEADRREVRALLRDLSVVVGNLEQLPHLVERMEAALKDSGPGSLWRTAKMADELGMTAKALREAARRGDVPAYQSTKGGSYYFDPLEVKQAIKGERNVPAL